MNLKIKFANDLIDLTERYFNKFSGKIRYLSLRLK